MVRKAGVCGRECGGRVAHPGSALALREATGAGTSGDYPMSDDRPKRDSMSIEEAIVSNMLEIAAIVEVLEQKGPLPELSGHSATLAATCPR